MGDEGLAKALVEEVRSNWEAVEPRLVVADWLREHGESSRGDAVASFAQRRAQPRSSAEHMTLGKGLAKAMKKERDWDAQPPPGGVSARYVGGLFSRLSAKADQLDTAATNQRMPFLQHLELSFDSAKGEDVLANLEVDELHQLTLNGAHGATTGAAALGRFAHPVRFLQFRDNVLSDASATALCDLPMLKHLERLAVKGANIGALGLEDVLNAAPKLRALELGVSGSHILNMDGYPSIESVDFDHMDLHPSGWGNAGYCFPKLQHVKHKSLTAGDPFTMEITRQDWALKSLNLYQPKLGDQGAAFLSAPWTELEELHLCQDEFDEAGWKAFDREWPALRALNLYLRYQDSSWLRSLHAVAGQLEVLRFSSSRPFMKDLFAVPWTKLHSLVLSNAVVLEEADVDLLLDTERFPSLRYLVLDKDYGPATVDVRRLRKAYGFGLHRMKRPHWEQVHR